MLVRQPPPQQPHPQQQQVLVVQQQQQPFNKRNLTKLSHQLSLGLRHKALEFGWNITPDGFVPVQDILNHSMFRHYTLRDIIETVQSNDKQRYTLQDRPLKNYFKATYDTVEEPAVSKKAVVEMDRNRDDVNDVGTLKESHATILCIRANQGHSIAMINSDLLLQRVTSEDLLQNYPIMVHGTNYTAWESIQSSGGLHKMQRNHIHFATGIPNNNKMDGTKNNNNNNSVISGMRKSCDVYIYINIHKCITDDISIYKSDNGVLLTAGVNDTGILPLHYVSHVADSAGTRYWNGCWQYLCKKYLPLSISIIVFLLLQTVLVVEGGNNRAINQWYSKPSKRLNEVTITRNTDVY